MILDHVAGRHGIQKLLDPVHSRTADQVLYFPIYSNEFNATVNYISLSN